MPSFRVASLWRLHLGLTCLGIMIAVPLLSGGDKPGQETRQQIAQSTHLHSTQTVHSVAAVIADRAEKLARRTPFSRKRTWALDQSRRPEQRREPQEERRQQTAPTMSPHGSS